MSFRDDLEMDIMNVFLTADELAEMHCINGKEMPASVSITSHERRRHNLQSYERGIYNKQTVISVAARDFGKLPAVNQPMVLDGKHYLVRSAREEYGMYLIALEVT